MLVPFLFSITYGFITSHTGSTYIQPQAEPKLAVSRNLHASSHCLTAKVQTLRWSCTQLKHNTGAYRAYHIEFFFYTAVLQSYCNTVVPSPPCFARSMDYTHAINIRSRLPRKLLTAAFPRLRNVLEKFRKCARWREGCSLPVEHMTDLCGFLPELATELATAQTTQDVEVEQKQNHILHLKVAPCNVKCYF